MVDFIIRELREYTHWKEAGKPSERWGLAGDDESEVGYDPLLRDS